MLGFSSLTRSRTYAPFSGGMSLDHGTTGEVSVQCFQMHFSGLSWWSHGWDCASAARFLIRELRSHMTCSKKKKRKEMPFSDFLISDGEWSLLPVGGKWFGFLEGCWKGENVLHSLLTKSPVLSFVSLWKWDDIP